MKPFEIELRDGKFPTVRFGGEEVVGVIGVTICAGHVGRPSIRLELLMENCTCTAEDADVETAKICPVCGSERDNDEALYAVGGTDCGDD